MKKLFSIGKSILKGAAIGTAETTLIPTLIREIKKLSTKEIMKVLDVNGDGRFNWKDIELMRWQQIGKFAAIILLVYVILHIQGSI